MGSPSFVGRRLQHVNADFSTEVAVEVGKDLEAGVVAFQNERFFSQFTLVQASGSHCLSVSSAVGELRRVPLADRPSSICLRMQLRGPSLTCQYSLDGEVWTEVGAPLDAKHLSTKTAGGFVGAYLGLYAFAESPARATFAWAAYQETAP